MRFRFNYLLWLLLLVFGLLYVYGTASEIVHGTVFPSTGLWGSLFASMIAVLLIDKVVRKTELQKSERSTRYVNGRIASTCEHLVTYLKPPSDWQERLNSEKLDFDDYFERVLSFRRQALGELDIILDRYSYLIETELRNDLFDIIALLSQWTWLALEEPTRCLADVLWNLCSFTNLTSALINESIETIRSHKLFERGFLSVSSKKGEPPKLEYSHILPQNIIEKRYLNYEAFLKEAVDFRDACYEKRRKYTEKKNAT